MNGILCEMCGVNPGKPYSFEYGRSFSTDGTITVLLCNKCVSRSWSWRAGGYLLFALASVLLQYAFISLGKWVSGGLKAIVTIGMVSTGVAALACIVGLVNTIVETERGENAAMWFRSIDLRKRGYYYFRLKRNRS